MISPISPGRLSAVRAVLFAAGIPRFCVRNRSPHIAALQLLRSGCEAKTRFPKHHSNFQFNTLKSCPEKGGVPFLPVENRDLSLACQVLPGRDGREKSQRRFDKFPFPWYTDPAEPPKTKAALFSSRPPQGCRKNGAVISRPGQKPHGLSAPLPVGKAHTADPVFSHRKEFLR